MKKQIIALLLVITAGENIFGAVYFGRSQTRRARDTAAYHSGGRVGTESIQGRVARTARKLGNNATGGTDWTGRSGGQQLSDNIGRATGAWTPSRRGQAATTANQMGQRADEATERLAIKIADTQSYLQDSFDKLAEVFKATGIKAREGLRKAWVEVSRWGRIVKNGMKKASFLSSEASSSELSLDLATTPEGVRAVRAGINIKRVELQEKVEEALRIGQDPKKYTDMIKRLNVIEKNAIKKTVDLQLLESATRRSTIDNSTAGASLRDTGRNTSARQKHIEELSRKLTDAREALQVAKEKQAKARQAMREAQRLATNDPTPEHAADRDAARTALEDHNAEVSDARSKAQEAEEALDQAEKGSGAEME